MLAIADAIGRAACVGRRLSGARLPALFGGGERSGGGLATRRRFATCPTVGGAQFAEMMQQILAIAAAMGRVAFVGPDVIRSAVAGAGRGW